MIAASLLVLYAALTIGQHRQPAETVPAAGPQTQGSSPVISVQPQ